MSRAIRKTQFTPGPWTVDPEASYADGWPILAKQGPLDVCPARANGHYDAHLIAAAPEMYAALERAQLAVSNAIELIGSKPQDPEYDTLRHIVSALAKARGEKP